MSRRKSSQSGKSATLLDLLRNHLILSRIVPFVPPSDLVSLAATCPSIYSLVFITHSSYTFRHLDLSNLDFAFVFPSCRYMNSDGYNLAAPLQSTFYVLKKRAVLQYVITLILDGVAVPAAVLREILCDDAFNVRVLSIRDVKELDKEQLMQILRYLVRPSRPKDSPKLKGLYYFTRRESEGRVTSPDKYHPGQYHVSDPNLPVPKTWINGGGSLFSTDEIAMKAWIQLIEACRDLIAFDVVVCHHAPGSDAPPELASVALGINGCHNCHSTLEAPRIFGQTPTHDLPLLSPPPLFASTVKAAQSPAPGESHRFYARCTQCLDDRWCYRCNAWWCENCCTPPAKAGELSPKLVSGIKINAGLCIQTWLVQDLYSRFGESGEAGMGS
ncbi:MAG: hypothetical protein Q9171_001307 [Xanthocarpia ochracea]